jgi:predicted metal-binding membrane protein
VERFHLSGAARVSSATRAVTVAALAAVAAVAWALLAKSARAMSTMSGEGILFDVAVAMMQPTATVPYLAVTAVMWAVMMAAMMTPAILPLVFLFQRLDRGGGDAADRGEGRADGALFASGYLAVWLVFGVAAALLQWGLHRAALLHTHALAAGPLLAGSILLVAGLYQLTPLKRACLKHCQTPAAFLLGSWRDGRVGAVRMGLQYGVHCVGCCWALMLLMFVGGVMSVAAMAVLSFFILAERLLPAAPWTASIPGITLVLWGFWTLAHTSG